MINLIPLLDLAAPAVNPADPEQNSAKNVGNRLASRRQFTLPWSMRPFRQRQRPFPETRNRTGRVQTRRMPGQV